MRAKNDYFQSGLKMRTFCSNFHIFGDIFSKGDILRDIGKQRFFKRSQNNVLFFEMLLFVDKCFKRSKKPFFSNIDIFGYMCKKNDFSMISIISRNIIYHEMLIYSELWQKKNFFQSDKGLFSKC